MKDGKSLTQADVEKVLNKRFKVSSFTAVEDKPAEKKAEKKDEKKAEGKAAEKKAEGKADEKK